MRSGGGCERRSPPSPRETLLASQLRPKAAGPLLRPKTTQHVCNKRDGSLTQATPISENISAQAIARTRLPFAAHRAWI
eukprot:9443161-Pyramimonas_sp.AAC.1